MGVVLIVLFICFVLGKRRRGRKRNRTTWHGKSDWEKTCDEGGKFFGW